MDKTTETRLRMWLALYSAQELRELILEYEPESGHGHDEIYGALWVELGALEELIQRMNKSLLV
jgi:hypothetical protein